MATWRMGVSSTCALVKMSPTQTEFIFFKTLESNFYALLYVVKVIRHICRCSEIQ